jgi:hypothetical protein
MHNCYTEESVAKCEIILARALGALSVFAVNPEKPKPI